MERNTVIPLNRPEVVYTEYIHTFEVKDIENECPVWKDVGKLQKIWKRTVKIRGWKIYLWWKSESIGFVLYMLVNENIIIF